MGVHAISFSTQPATLKTTFLPEGQQAGHIEILTQQCVHRTRQTCQPGHRWLVLAVVLVVHGLVVCFLKKITSEDRPNGLRGQTGVVDSDTKMKVDQQATRSGRQLAGSWTTRWLALDAVD